MKKILKRLSPHPDKIKNHKYLSKLKLDNPSLWNFNRRSINKGVAIGLFCAFLPMPMQMVAAAIFAVALSGNILISIALVWITNPITMAPIFYATYKLGALILNVEIIADFEFSIDYIFSVFTIVWKPLLLGSLIASTVSSIIGYHTINFIYLYKFNKRKTRTKLNNK